MNISVIGCGRWGSFIAWYLDEIGYNVALYGRPSSRHLQEFRTTRTNGLVTLPEKIKLTDDLSEILKAEIIVISVNSQGFRDLLREVASFQPTDKRFVLCMKGIEIASGERLTEIFSEYLAPQNTVAVWLGPGHVQEFCKGVPNCMVIDSADETTKQMLIKAFDSDLIRFYYGNDLIGNEIGAAAKNVIGIAAGMLDGLNLTSLKGALMSRGTREIARLIKEMGGQELSAYGLCHLGDYEATVFSQFSNNRRFGECFVKGEEYTKLAEGYYTVEALLKLGEQYKVELPICNAVHEVLYEHSDAQTAISKLFLRSLKQEF